MEISLRIVMKLPFVDYRNIIIASSIYTRAWGQWVFIIEDNRHTYIKYNEVTQLKKRSKSYISYIIVAVPSLFINNVGT